MAVDNFLGISLEFDQSLSQFQGISFELSENLIIKVVDGQGNSVDGAEVTFTIGNTTETALTQANGTVGFLVEEQSTITVSATFECLFSGEVDILHDGIDDFRSITLTLQELPCLEEKPANRFNFVRWQISNNLSFPLQLPVLTCLNCNDVDFDIPNGIQRPIQKECIPYTPIMLQGETYSFFTNFDSDLKFNVNESTPLKVGILEEGESNVSESHDCNVINQPLGDYFYSEFTLGNVGYGYYRLVVYNSTNNQIYAISNLLHVKPNANKKRTALIKYRNSDDIDGFSYNDLPDFYNQIRIDLYQGDARNYEPEVEEENQVVSAEKRYISIANRLGIPVVSEFLDSEAQDGLESFLAHDEIYVNGKRYNARAEDLSYEQLDQAYNLYRANYVLFDYSYARNNRYK